jgi:hypothetical protein
MSHPHIKTKYIRDLLANEMYQAWKAMEGRHLDRLYGDDFKGEFNSYLFGLDTAYHRIDQRIVSGELSIVLSSD